MYGGITCDSVFIIITAQQLKYYQPPVVSHPIPLEEPVLIIDLSDLPDGVLGNESVLTFLYFDVMRC